MLQLSIQPSKTARIRAANEANPELDERALARLLGLLTSDIRTALGRDPTDLSHRMDSEQSADHSSRPAGARGCRPSTLFGGARKTCPPYRSDEGRAWVTVAGTFPTFRVERTRAWQGLCSLGCRISAHSAETTRNMKSRSVMSPYCSLARSRE